LIVPEAASFAMIGFSRRASPIELSTKVFGFRSAFWPQAGRAKKNEQRINHRGHGE
jgi:hypothetical protein